MFFFLVLGTLQEGRGTIGDGQNIYPCVFKEPEVDDLKEIEAVAVQDMNVAVKSEVVAVNEEEAVSSKETEVAVKEKNKKILEKVTQLFF